MFNKKFIPVFVFILMMGNISVAHSAVINAYQIFMQAQRGNHGFFDVLSKHKNAIDLRTKNGYTAYCLAMIAEDDEAMDLLRRYGANENHNCVKKIDSTRENKWREDKFASQKEFKVAPATSNVGVLAGLAVVGGGVAIAASGGGGGGSKVSADNKPNENTGNEGNNNNEGGSGDNAGGDNFTGENEDLGGDNVGGEEEIPGGGNIGNDDIVYNTSAFETDEYKKGNFLEEINASSVYARIYKDGEAGKNINGEPLKEIKVGVWDTGVYNAGDLDGKIIKAYDSNRYNDQATIRSYVDSNSVEYFVVEQNGYYYMLRASSVFDEELGKNGTSIVIYEKDRDTHNKAMTLAEVKEFVQFTWGLNFNDLVVVNTGGGTPGVYLDLTNDETIEKTVGNLSDLSHGTHVAGIIAGSKDNKGMHGVAFDNAKIVANSWDLRFDNGTFFDNLIDMVDKDNISVLNVSLGLNNDTGKTAKDATAENLVGLDELYEYTAENNVVWVQAAGNDSKNDADLMAGLGLLLAPASYEKGEPYKDVLNAKKEKREELGINDKEVPMLVVAALGKDGTIASYSNKCGSTSGFCLAAPGSDIYSTGTSKDGEISKSGTSMATPVVSGSIALLNGYYPWLNGQNVAYLLLKTADDSGIYADENTYGQGKLDLEAAVTTPVDGLFAATSSSFNDVSSIGNSKLSLSSVMQNKMLKSMPKTITAFDGLNRPFDYNTENMVNTVHASNANLRNTVSRMAMVGDKKVIKDEKSGFQFSSTEAMDNSGKANLASMEVINETENGSTRFWYAENTKYDRNEGVLVDTSNPYFAMNEAYGAENTLNLSDTSKLKLSLQTGQNGLYERDYEQDNHSFDEQSHAVNAEYSYNMTDYLELSALGGMLFENDAVLGMNGVGGFSIKDSSTYFMGVKAALNLTDNISLIASYYRGYTNGSDASMLSISDLETESFMLAGEYALDKKNKVGLSLVSPLSVVKGNASFNYATGRDSYSDTIYMNKLTTSLRPEAKEYDLGLYYKGQTDNDVNLMGKVEARFNADGEKGLTDYIGVVGVSSAF